MHAIMNGFLHACVYASLSVSVCIHVPCSVVCVYIFRYVGMVAFCMYVFVVYMHVVLCAVHCSFAGYAVFSFFRPVASPCARPCAFRSFVLVLWFGSCDSDALPHCCSLFVVSVCR